MSGDFLRRNSTRVAFYSPFVMGAITLAFVTIDEWLGQPAAAARVIVLFVNGFAAFAGSAAGGLLRDAELVEKVTLAVGFGTAGLVTYFAIAGCLGAMGHVF